LAEVKANQSFAWKFSFGFEMARIPAAGLSHPLYAEWVEYRRSNRAAVQAIETRIDLPSMPSFATQQVSPNSLDAEPDEVETAVRDPNPKSSVVLPTESLLEGIYPDDLASDGGSSDGRARGQKYDGHGAGSYSQGDKNLSPRERVRALEAQIRQNRARGSLSSSRPPGTLTRDQRESIQRRMSGGE